VDYGESLEAAAVREAREETGLNIRLIELMHAYSDPKRDSRGHTVSAVFIAEADGLPHGQDDALQAAVFTAVTLPSPLVFDHGKILSDYFRYRRGTPRDKIFGYHIA
jgi:8-oxo-dGTP diphosphatase